MLKFLWYRFESSVYFKSLIKKKTKTNNESYFKYVQVKSTGVNSEKGASKLVLESLIMLNILKKKTEVAKYPQNTQALKKPNNF